MSRSPSTFNDDKNERLDRFSHYSESAVREDQWISTRRVHANLTKLATDLQHETWWVQQQLAEARDAA